MTPQSCGRLMCAKRFAPSVGTAYKIKTAQAGGEVHSPYAVSGWLAGDCTNPQSIGLWGHSYERPSGEVAGPYEVNAQVRCRKCQACLVARSNHWAFRATREIEAAQRTWFVTLTFRPALIWAFEAKRLLGGKSVFDQAFREVQLFLKRMRKSGHKVRFLLATEAHRSGRPHFHMLLHEDVTSPPVSSRDLSGNRKERRKPKWWHNGLVHCRLVDPKRKAWDVAWYVAKYMSKTSEAKIRASIKYGGGKLGGFEEPPPKKQIH